MLPCIGAPSPPHPALPSLHTALRALTGMAAPELQVAAAPAASALAGGIRAAAPLFWQQLPAPTAVLVQTLPLPLPLAAAIVAPRPALPPVAAARVVAVTAVAIAPQHQPVGPAQADRLQGPSSRTVRRRELRRKCPTEALDAAAGHPHPAPAEAAAPAPSPPRPDAGMEPTQRKFDELYPKAIVVGTDLGRVNVWRSEFEFPRGVWNSDCMTRVHYYAFIKVGARRLARERLDRRAPGVLEARAELARHSPKTTSPAAFRAHLACRLRTDPILWPHSLKPRNAQERFAAHSAKHSVWGRFFQRLWKRASDGGKRRVMVAIGDANFASSGRGEPGGAPGSWLLRKARECFNKPGVTVDIVDEHRTTAMGYSGVQARPVCDPRSGHCLAKKAFRETRARRRQDRAAHASAALAPPLPLPQQPLPPPAALPPHALPQQQLQQPQQRVSVSGRGRRAAQHARADERSRRDAVARGPPLRSPPLPVQGAIAAGGVPAAPQPGTAAPPGGNVAAAPVADTRRHSHRGARRRSWARHAAVQRLQAPTDEAAAGPPREHDKVRGLMYDPGPGFNRIIDRDANSARNMCDVLKWGLTRGPGDGELPPHLARGGPRLPRLPPFILRVPAAQASHGVTATSSVLLGSAPAPGGGSAAPRSLQQQHTQFGEPGSAGQARARPGSC